MVSFVDKYQIESLLGVEYGNNRIYYVDTERKTSMQNIIRNTFRRISMNQKNKLKKQLNIIITENRNIYVE